MTSKLLRHLGAIGLGDVPDSVCWGDLQHPEELLVARAAVPASTSMERFPLAQRTSSDEFDRSSIIALVQPSAV